MNFRSLPALGGLLLAACQPETTTWHDEYDWVWEGDLVTLYAYERSEDEICGGSLEAVEGHTISIAEFFGYDETVRYRYRWMSDAVFEGKCHPQAGACAAQGVPWTRNLPDMHELSHAVSYNAGNYCPSVLEEGVAAYFGSPRYRSWWDEDSGEYVPWIADVLTAAPLEFRDYERAGNFASFLIEEYGPELLVELCKAVPYYNTLEHWRSAVPEVLGLELNELLAEYETYPRCHRQQYRARLWECTGPAHVSADPEQEVVFEVELDCAAEGVLGPYGDSMVATRRVAIPEAGSYRFEFFDSTGEEVFPDFNLQECAACSEIPDVFANTELGNVYAFNVGVYDLLIYADEAYAETLTIHIIP